jgi:hypothetical protein
VAASGVGARVARVRGGLAGRWLGDDEQGDGGRAGWWHRGQPGRPSRVAAGEG